VCPVFDQEGTEVAVARGKVQLFRGLARGELSPSKEMNRLASNCLLCRACTENCPSGIPVDRIVLGMRARLAADQPIPLSKRFLLRKVLPRRRLGFAVRTLQQAWRSTGLDNLAALAWPRAGALSKVPVAAPAAFRDSLWSPDRRGLFQEEKGALVLRPPRSRHRVAYFFGCANNHFFPGHGWDLLLVLAQAGGEVVIPPQTCCGLPHLAGGDTATARKLVEQNHHAFTHLNVEAVVADCASCSSALKEQSGLFPVPVEDAIRFLVSVGAPAAAEYHLASGAHRRSASGAGQPARQVVTYHDPCHASRYQGIREEPRKLLAQVPGLELKEMVRPDRCCGGSGVYGLEHPEISQCIGQSKMEDILATGARVVATTCPSCQMQLLHLLKQYDRIRVAHPVSLLAESYRQYGLSLESICGG